MLNKILLALVFLIISSGSSFAGKPDWRGVAVLTNVSAGCNGDYDVGNSIPIRYRANNLGNTDAESHLAFHQTFYAQSYSVTGRFPVILTAVTGGETGAGTDTFPAKASLVITPKTYSLSTTNLTFVGQIVNFENVVGTVSFNAAATLH